MTSARFPAGSGAEAEALSVKSTEAFNYRADGPVCVCDVRWITQGASLEAGTLAEKAGNIEIPPCSSFVSGSLASRL